jgi:hypothetical protein
LPVLDFRAALSLFHGEILVGRQPHRPDSRFSLRPIPVLPASVTPVIFSCFVLRPVISLCCFCSASKDRFSRWPLSLKVPCLDSTINCSLGVDSHSCRISFFRAEFFVAAELFLVLFVNRLPFINFVLFDGVMILAGESQCCS